MLSINTWNKSSNLGESLNRSQRQSCSTAYSTPIGNKSFADDLTNPIDCFSLLWDGRGDPLHPSPRERGGWATGSRRDRRRPQETSAPVTRFEKKLPTAPLIAPKDKPQRASASRHRVETCAPTEAGTQDKAPRKPTTVAW